MKKDIVGKTLNEQKYRMLKKLVYLNMGSGRTCLMKKDIVGKTLNEQKYRRLEKLVYLKLGPGLLGPGWDLSGTLPGTQLAQKLNNA